MNNNAEDDLELLKQQLEQVKQQDRILAEIENRFYKINDIAKYATNHRLSTEERNQLNKQIQDHEAAIKSIGSYLSN